MTKLKHWSALALATLFAACSSDDFGGNSDAEGQIQLQLTVDTQPLGSQNSRAELQELSKDDMKIRLTAEDGTLRTWNSVAEFDNEEKFAIGNYTLEVYYGAATDQGYEKPYVYGSTELTVHHDQTTKVNVEAKLANSMVTVAYSDNVDKFISNYTANLNSDKGNAVVTYSDTSRPVYITPGEVTLSLDFTDADGNEKYAPVTTFTAIAQNHYTINIDINGGEIGDAVLKVTFDDEMSEYDVDIALEDLTAPAAPSITSEGFTDGDALPVVASVALTNDLYYSVISRGSLKSLTLDTENNSLLSKNNKVWPASIDLVEATDAQQATLKALGLNVRGLWGNGSGEKTDLVVVDFQDIVANLANDTEGTIKFTLTAIDKYDQVCDAPVTLTLEVTPLTLELSGVPAEVWEGEESFTITVKYNGGNPDSKLQVLRQNTRGTYDSVPATFTTTSEDNVYTVNVNPTEAWGSDIVILVSEKEGSKKKSEQYTIEYVKMPSITVTEGSTWATKAYVTIRDNIDGTYYCPDNLTYSINGVDFDQNMTSAGDGKQMLISGLDSSTTYEITVSNPLYPTDADRALNKITFTTEAATQLPDAGFDEWTSTKLGDYQYLWKVNDGSVWGTLNDLTTSTHGSGSGNGASYGGAAYKATSGTIPANGRSTQSSASGGLIGTTVHGDGHTQGNATLHSDKQHSGSNAALIRTVGWGNGNNAPSAVTSGTCDNFTPGELYLGKYDGNSANYGYDFASRPTSLSFYYHYDVVTSGNGDYGTAEISVYDTDGNVIASATQNLTEQSDYTQVTMNLDYATTSKKAAKISVIFKSSGNGSVLANNTTYVRRPGTNNTSGGEYVGSELYIDEVTLNY